MKAILRVLVLFLISFKLSSQNKAPLSKLIYLDSTCTETQSENYKYIRLIEKYYSDQESYVYKEFYRSEVLKCIGTTLDKDILKLDGQYISFYENGKKESTVNYSNNKKSGKEFNWYENGDVKSELEYYESKDGETEFKINNFWNPQKEKIVIDGNGNLEKTEDNIYEKGEIKNGEKQGIWEGKDFKKKYSFTENYHVGKLISGTSVDENNNKFEYIEVFEKPAPAKGMANFYKYISKHYPTPKIEGLAGKIYITFIIDKEGNPIDLKILRDIGHNTGEDAIKTIINYGKWIPGKMRGIPHNVSYSLPITIQAKGKINSTQPFQQRGNNLNNDYQRELLRNF